MFDACWEHSVRVCCPGGKFSQGAAAGLQTHDVPTETLKGWQFALRSAEYPMIDAAKLPAPAADRHIPRVTQHRSKSDRIACRRFLRRFAVTGAQSLFVDRAPLDTVAEHLGATAFDLLDGVWNHHGNQGCRWVRSGGVPTRWSYCP